MGDEFLRKLAAAALSIGTVMAPWTSLPAAAESGAESWDARCSGVGDANLCVMAALQNSERALIAAVSERTTEMRRAKGADPYAIENDQIQWMARVQNGCAGRADSAPVAEFDLVFAQCVADAYDARSAELTAAR